MLREKTIKIFLMLKEMAHNQVGIVFLHVLTDKLQHRPVFLQQYTVHVSRPSPPRKVIELVREKKT